MEFTLICYSMFTPEDKAIEITFSGSLDEVYQKYIEFIQEANHQSIRCFNCLIKWNSDGENNSLRHEVGVFGTGFFRPCLGGSSEKKILSQLINIQKSQVST
jgi:hypothetical protein